MNKRRKDYKLDMRFKSNKKLKTRKEKVVRNLKIAVVLYLVGSVTFTTFTLHRMYQDMTDHITQSREAIIPVLDSCLTGCEGIVQEEVALEHTPKPLWAGEASYYSHAGCEGCTLGQITASGEPFDENALTLAFNHAPFQTMVRVTNVENGMSVVARVNDTGGFNQLGRDNYYRLTGDRIYNDLDKIADLSLATKNAIGCGDVCDVTVQEL